MSYQPGSEIYGGGGGLRLPYVLSHFTARGMATHVDMNDIQRMYMYDKL